MFVKRPPYSVNVPVTYRLPPTFSLPAIEALPPIAALLVTASAFSVANPDVLNVVKVPLPPVKLLAVTLSEFNPDANITPTFPLSVPMLVPGDNTASAPAGP